MKAKFINVFWGVVLILVSALLLAEALGYVSFNSVSDREWAIAIGVVSGALFLTYLLSGVRRWGWLFPALGCAAIALAIWMKKEGVADSLIGVPILASLALPFYVGFVLDRRRWGLLILAAILTEVAILISSERFLEEDWGGAIFMFMFALPFLVAYLWSKRNWWAAIPAGFFATVGLVVLLETFVPHQTYPALPNHLSIGVFIWVMFLGFAAMFGLVWLRRKSASTDWAKYPAAGLLALSMLALLLGEHFQEVWLAVVTLVAGATLLAATLIRKKPLADQGRLEGKA